VNTAKVAVSIKAATAKVARRRLVVVIKVAPPQGDSKEAVRSADANERSDQLPRCCIDDPPIPLLYSLMEQPTRNAFARSVPF
jgi:hypothetical protein